MNQGEVKAIRLHLGYTQRELSQKLGVTVNTVSRWETGKCMISQLAELRLKNLVKGE